jgi:thiol-disulfide isomerase/thioredoxin
VFLTVAILSGATGFYLNRGGQNSPEIDAAVKRLMVASLEDPDGAPQKLSQWRGKVLVVNFWATWCAPCREEIPVLSRAQNKYSSIGVQFVGIAIDHVAKVRDYAKQMAINYVLLIGGIETLGVSKELGNRAGVLPYTVVMNRAGNVVYVHAGAMTEAALASVLAPYL